jgi:hypothetical protein
MKFTMIIEATAYKRKIETDLNRLVNTDTSELLKKRRVELMCEAHYKTHYNSTTANLYKQSDHVVL